MLILGAAKSGTSSLYQYLRQHPDIFMPRFKEPQFFIWDGREYDIRGPGVDRVGRNVVRDLDSYLKLFSDARDERIRGEASTGYLHTPGVPERIRAYVPDAQLMAILRNPIDRAYSSFVHAQRDGFEPLADFESALKEEPSRIASGWIGLTHYTGVGMYAAQIQRFLKLFPCDQIRIYLFDDLVRDPGAVVQDAFRYLGVDHAFAPEVSVHANRGRSVRSVGLGQLAAAVRKAPLARRLPSTPFRKLLRAVNERTIEPLPQRTRRQLAEVFEEDVRNLSQLIGRDLSPWLTDRSIGTSPTEIGAHPCL